MDLPESLSDSHSPSRADSSATLLDGIYDRVRNASTDDMVKAAAVVGISAAAILVGSKLRTASNIAKLVPWRATESAALGESTTLTAARTLPSSLAANEGAIAAVKSDIMVDGTRRVMHGSGVIVREDGVIVTAAHVVRDGDPATISVVGPSRNAFRAELVGFSPKNDLAILKLSERPPAPLPTVRLPADTPLPAPGERWVNIGRVGPHSAADADKNLFHLDFFNSRFNHGVPDFSKLAARQSIADPNIAKLQGRTLFAIPEPPAGPGFSGGGVFSEADGSFMGIVSAGSMSKNPVQLVIPVDRIKQMLSHPDIVKRLS